MKPAWNLAEEKRQLKIFEERAVALHKLVQDDPRQNVFDFLARVTQEKIWLLTIVEQWPKDAKKDKAWFKIGKGKSA